MIRILRVAPFVFALALASQWGCAGGGEEGGGGGCGGGSQYAGKKLQCGPGTYESDGSCKVHPKYNPEKAAANKPPPSLK